MNKQYIEHEKNELQANVSEIKVKYTLIIKKLNKVATSKGGQRRLDFECKEFVACIMEGLVRGTSLSGSTVAGRGEQKVSCRVLVMGCVHVGTASSLRYVLILS